MNDRIKKDIIDNRNGITMAYVLNSEIPNADTIDISTGFFNVDGYALLEKALCQKIIENKFNMRLLLGKEAILPEANSFEKYAQKYKIWQQDDLDSISMKTNINDHEITVKSKTTIDSLINFLKNTNVQVRLGKTRFNHSKCYIMGGNSVFIGSSNFTAGGLTGNYELNAGLYQPGAEQETRKWFDIMWDNADDAKDDLIHVLEESKFGSATIPFIVYMKMLFERFRPLLENAERKSDESKTLTKFQQDAVRTGLFIMSEVGGVIIADATGLGKTNMGIDILRQKILKEGKRAMLVAPAQVLHSMWEEKLIDSDINVKYKLSMEEMGRDSILENLARYKNIDLILIDESQNFRSKDAKRRKNLMKLLSVGDKKKQIVLLSATPINNTIMDLYYQLSIITGDNNTYFHRLGIPDLYKHMRDAANREGLQRGLEKIQQLLDSVMVRRTRSYIKTVYKDDQVNGQRIKFPKHEYLPITYSLSEIFGNIFKRLLEDMNKLSMAPYGIEQYNNNISDIEKKKHMVRAHLQTILLLKRFESSVEAVKISLKNKITLYEYVQKVISDGRILRVRDFNDIMMKWHAYDDEGDDSDSEEDMEQFFLNEIQKIKTEVLGKNYETERLKKDMSSDLIILRNLLKAVETITLDKKTCAVVDAIVKDKALETESKKIIIFTEYKDTAKYLKKEFETTFKKTFAEKTILLITGNTKQKTRQKYIKMFAPKANRTEDDDPDQGHADILISTEVLSEGQNLQDCNYVINYDLPWNPMRIVQRTGRIDRLTSPYAIVHSRACYPDDALNDLLKLMVKLIDKIHTVRAVIGTDTEIIGEPPTPKQFNGSAMPAIRALAGNSKDASGIIEDLERSADMMPSASPLNEISKYVKEIGMEQMSSVQMGRRSGKRGAEPKAVLAYLQDRPERRVYFVVYDYKSRKATVPDDDFEAIRLASCTHDEAKYLPMDDLDNSGSFEELLKLDVKSKQAIKIKNEQIREDIRISKSDRRSKHKKNIQTVTEAITNEVESGNIASEQAQEVLDILESDQMRPWADEVNRLISEYDRVGDIASVIQGITNLGKNIYLVKKMDERTYYENDDDPNLKLIGAMFITGDKFDPELGKKGIAKYT